MKVLFGIVILGAAASVFGQDAAGPVRAVMPVTATDVILTGVKKNAPFTADESGETVRIMPDGNRIVENWTGRTARTSDGRMRREITSGKVGSGSARPFIFGNATGGSGVVAVGAGNGVHFTMRSKSDTETGGPTIVTAPAEGSQEMTVIATGSGEDGRRVVLRRIEAAEAARAEGHILLEPARRAAVEAEAVRTVLPAHSSEKFNTRRESLGLRDFGGVQAEGTRAVTTIPAGAIGNEREIEITSETWYSKELGVIVYSKRFDPRFGETTYQMTNIIRAEPDPSLFQGR